MPLNTAFFASSHVGSADRVMVVAVADAVVVVVEAVVIVVIAVMAVVVVDKTF